MIANITTAWPVADQALSQEILDLVQQASRTSPALYKLEPTSIRAPCLMTSQITDS